MEKTPKKNNSRFRLVIGVMLTAILLIAELYVMINQAQNLVLVVGIAVLILIALYLAVSAALDFLNQKEIAAKEQFDNLARSDKAAYMLLKKNIDALSKQVKVLERGNADNEIDFTEIINAQKAVAKIIINKNSESQERLFYEMNSIEASLEDSVRGLSEKLSGFQEEIERLADHIAKINTEAIQEASKNNKAAYIVEEVLDDEIADSDLDFDSLFEDDLSDGQIEDEEMSADDILNQLLAEEELVEEEAVEESELIPTPVAAPADNGGKMDQDDIAALIASMTGGDTAPVEEPTPEPIPVPTSAADNGGKMDQDDIAALIASMTGGM